MATLRRFNTTTWFASASAVALAACALTGPAFAQGAAAQPSVSAESPPAEDEVEVEAVVVTGVRGSIQRSLAQKRNAEGIVDAISAEDIGKFPDLNLSESLQRIPGVTLDRNSVGEGQSVNLRGLGPEFTRVEINGMSGTSNGTGGRFGNSEGGRGFNFEILASELFTNAAVHKTSSADQEEGGLAGVVQLETPKPFDYRGARYTVSAQGNHSDIADTIDPRGAVLVSHNFNDVFGIAASLAYADTTFRSDTAEGGSYRPFAGANTGTRGTDEQRAALNPNGTRYYYFAEERETLGGTVTLQYRPVSNLLFTLDGIFGSLKSDRLALRDDAAIESGANAPVSATIQNGVITSGQFTGIQQRVGANFFTTEENLRQITARAAWSPAENWTIRPFIGYSTRKSDRTADLYSFRLARNGVFDPGIVSYTIRGDFVDFASTATDFSSNPDDFLFNVFIFRPSLDEDSEFSTKLDFERTFESPLESIKFGVRYADRTKTRVATQERLQRSAGVAATAPPNLGSVFSRVDFDVSGVGPAAPNQLLSVDLGRVREVFFPGGSAVAGTFVRPLPGFGAQQSYEIGEKTFNAYGLAEFEIDRLDFNAGLRYVRTEQTSSGFTVANLFLPTERISPISQGKTYNALLPSATLRYEVRDDVLLRAAYSRTLTRPGLADLAPSETVAGIDQSGGRGSRGNPELDPFLADNVDVGLEWYFAEEGLLAANVFYKDIQNFIDTTTFTELRTFPRQSDGVLVTGPIIFTQPVNGVRAEIKGVELLAQSRLTFLPEGRLQNLGVILNYTFNDSSADFNVSSDVRSQGLPGLSRHSYNAVLYYDDGRFDARFAYAWRNRYLAQFSDDFGVPRFTNAFGQLDFSASYDIRDNVTAQVQALNLTKEQSFNVSSASYLPYGVAELDRRILFGLRLTY